MAEHTPSEYLKFKYSAPPECCKCGNCQLVPPAVLRDWQATHDGFVKALTYAQIDLGAARDLARNVLGEPHGLNQTIAIVEAALASSLCEQDR